MGTGDRTDRAPTGDWTSRRAGLGPIELRLHDAVDLAGGTVDTTPVDGAPSAEDRAERLAALGVAAAPALLAQPTHRLTPQVPYQAAPEGWLDVFADPAPLEVYTSGPDDPIVWWRLPRFFDTEFMSGVNFNLRDPPLGSAVLSLEFEAWPHQGATGVVVVDIGAERTEIPVSAPVAHTVDIGFTQAADNVDARVFWRPGIYDFVFRSVSLASGAVDPVTGRIGSAWSIARARADRRQGGREWRTSSARGS